MTLQEIFWRRWQADLLGTTALTGGHPGVVAMLLALWRPGPLSLNSL